jgi:HPr kinase/phosphorylase
VRHFLELRGIGIVHVPSLFGEGSVAASAPVELVVQLEVWGQAAVERVGLDTLSYTLGRHEIASVRLPVGPGRNIASLVEVAARNHQLRSRGRSGVEELDQRVVEALRRRDAP